MQATVKLIEADEVNSPTMWREVAPSGRAVCRICGEKIAKGEERWAFYHSFTDGGTYNPWTSVECRAHIACLPGARAY